MPIKYAEITIIINTEKETMSNYLNRILLGNENKTNDNDTIIILFDDETIYDTKKYCTDTKFSKLLKMGPTHYKRDIPIYFEIEDHSSKYNNITFFSKKPREDNGTLKLDFKPIFANNKNFITSIKEPSTYNVIYYDLSKKEDLLAIVRLKSNAEKPRFLIAYDEEHFEKEHIIYFVNYIFKI